MRHGLLCAWTPTQHRAAQLSLYLFILCHVTIDLFGDDGAVDGSACEACTLLALSGFQILQSILSGHEGRGRIKEEGRWEEGEEKEKRREEERSWRLLMTRHNWTTSESSWHHADRRGMVWYGMRLCSVMWCDVEVDSLTQLHQDVHTSVVILLHLFSTKQNKTKQDNPKQCD